MYFIHGMYKKVKYIHNIKDGRKKERKYPTIIIYYVKIINSPKPKRSNYELEESF